MPSALITGITGQDGSYLADLLHADGWTVHALIRHPESAHEEKIADWVVRHTGDLLDADSLGNAVSTSEPDVVFNLAGLSSVAQSWERPELTSRTTGLAAAILLDSAWQLQQQIGKQVRFVQASSSEIFGAAEVAPQSESTPIHPVSPYGAAKAFAHHMVGVYRGRGMFSSAAILYNHESPRRPTSFVTRKITNGVAQIATGASETLVLGNLDAQRDWGWAPDFVQAMSLLANAEQAGDYIVASGEVHSVRDFVAAAFAAAGISDWERYIEVDQQFMRPVDAPLMTGDSSKLRRELGWGPTMSFEEIVAAMVQYDLELLSR